REAAGGGGVGRYGHVDREDVVREERRPQTVVLELDREVLVVARLGELKAARACGRADRRVGELRRRAHRRLAAAPVEPAVGLILPASDEHIRRRGRAEQGGGRDGGDAGQ